MAETLDVTGFQSPCAEYAEDVLSLDNKFLTDKPAMKFVRASQDYPHHNILKGDILLIHRGQKPKAGQSVVAVIDNVFIFAKYQCLHGKDLLMPYNRPVGDVEKGEDFIWGI